MRKERKMNPGQIAESYDLLAEKWNSNTFPRNYGIDEHKQAVRFLNKKNAPVYALDLGCGSSGRIIDLLLSYGFMVEGLDISPRMIELAKQRHPDLTFYHADICEWEFPRKYRFISAWDSIWHLPLAVQEPVLKKILQNLNPGGVFIFTTGGLDAPAEKVDSAMGQPLYYSTPGIPSLLKLVSETGCLCRHLEYDQYPESHLYMIVQKPPGA